MHLVRHAGLRGLERYRGHNATRGAAAVGLRIAVADGRMAASILRPIPRREVLRRATDAELGAGLLLVAATGVTIGLTATPVALFPARGRWGRSRTRDRRRRHGAVPHIHPDQNQESRSKTIKPTSNRTRTPRFIVLILGGRQQQKAPLRGQRSFRDSYRASRGPPVGRREIPPATIGSTTQSDHPS